MAELRFIKDYVAELKNLGEVEFAGRHRASVLLGVGMVGELTDAGGGAGRTVAVQTVSSETQNSVGLVGHVWPLRKERAGPGGISVGRGQDNDVVISEYSISQKHCEFIMAPTGTQIKDLGATNGTQVAGHRLMARRALPIKDGEQVILGRFEFQFMTAKSFCQRVAELAQT